jgi:spermidine synthase
VTRACCDIFPSVEYAYTAIPTYPSGQIGFMILSNTAKEGFLRTPARTPDAVMQVIFVFWGGSGKGTS